MKRLLVLGVLMACLCTPVLAAKNSEKFDLPWKVTIGETQLPAGRCVITWTEPSGTDVQLTITGADKKAITVPAKLVPGKAPQTGPMTSEVDGVRQLKGFRTKDATISIEGAPGATK
jgi:hypothetical protein